MENEMQKKKKLKDVVKEVIYDLQSLNKKKNKLKKNY